MATYIFLIFCITCDCNHLIEEHEIYKILNICCFSCEISLPPFAYFLSTSTIKIISSYYTRPFATLVVLLHGCSRCMAVAC